jgi:hypothetical protein
MIRRLSAVLSALLLLLCAATVLLWVLAYWGQYVVQVVILRPQPGNAAWQSVLNSSAKYRKCSRGLRVWIEAAFGAEGHLLL